MSELDKFYQGATLEHRRKDWTPAYILLGIAGLVTVMVVALAVMVAVVTLAVAATVAVVAIKGSMKK